MIELYYVEDDPEIASLVTSYLEQKNFKVTIYHTVSEIRRALTQYLPSLVLLDVNLPDGSGNSLCLWIRRTRDSAAPYLSCGGIILDQNRRSVTCHLEEINLTASEYQLLLYLMQNKGRTVTRGGNF